MSRDKMDEPRLIGESHRRPRWQKWRQIESIKIWDGVALSLNIDPDQVRVGYDWDLGKNVFDESQEFKDRADIMFRKFGGRFDCPPCFSSTNMVSFDEFAAGAISFDWSVPPEFIEMAAKNSAQPTSKAEGQMKSPSAPLALTPTYTTKLLRIVDAIRAEIGSDAQPHHWTRDAIEARSHELLSELSFRDAEAIATVLLHDEKRLKLGGYGTLVSKRRNTRKGATLKSKRRQ
jgi:hypothetical protein